MLKAWFASWPSAWLRLRRLPWADRWLLFEAVVCLGLARLAVCAISLRRLAPFLGRHMTESSREDLTGSRHACLRGVAWALSTASARLPWRCLCLEQAIAGKLMLRRRAIANTMYLGAARTEDGMQAHAWLRSGSFIVTGAEGHLRFAIVSTFADEERCARRPAPPSAHE